MNEKQINRAFYDKVKKLRELQKKFFREHDRSLMERECRPLEREIDNLLISDFVPELDAARLFRRHVRQMRACQDSFFRRYSKETLVLAKRAEKKVDQWITNTEKNEQRRLQPTLQFLSYEH